MRCTRRAESAPDVGFCFLVAPAISVSESEQVARIGMPLGLKSVYVADTEVTYATKRTVENDPQENCTHGGEGAFAPMLCWVTSQQESSSSTCCCTSLEDGSAERSRKTSSCSWAGSLPVNFGGAPRS